MRRLAGSKMELSNSLAMREYEFSNTHEQKCYAKE
jgi:hypothetical protein